MNFHSEDHSLRKMKGLSLFFLKNSMGAKMRKSFQSSCNGETSTSTLNQHLTSIDPPQKSVTLEEMILQLELEEELAQRAKLLDDHQTQNQNQHHEAPRRMSCVNNSDILRSARNALNQYPRFSLDGKDAMYKSSFRKISNRNSLMCSGDEDEDQMGLKLQKIRRARRSSSVGGESVVWCNPGVVARLMGLEAMPVPVGRMKSSHKSSRISSREEGFRNQNLRRSGRRNEMERRKEFLDVCSSSRTGYCRMRPISSKEARLGFP